MCSIVMEWTNEKVIKLLEVLETEPCLWDPRNAGYKSRVTQNDAWRRIKQVLPFPTTIEDMKKKKESLMGYYRIHLNKYRKSLETNEIYVTTWFAFEKMDSFLRPVYDSSRTLNTTVSEENAMDRSESEYEGNAYNYLALEMSEGTKNNERDSVTLHSENETSQEFKPIFLGKRHPKDELPPKVIAAQRQMHENFKQMQGSTYDEYEIFGRLVAIKLKKLKNPNTRENLMNDIHNLIFNACMQDRLEQQASDPLSTHPPVVKVEHSSQY